MIFLSKEKKRDWKNYQSLTKEGGIHINKKGKIGGDIGDRTRNLSIIG